MLDYTHIKYLQYESIWRILKQLYLEWRNIYNNKQEFYNYCNTKRNKKSEDMANAFNEHFINIGSNLAQLIP
jgi:arsenate reductase-like glutaredoxin family protein